MGIKSSTRSGTGLLLAVSFGIAVLAGCGGSGGSNPVASRGNAMMTITWPEASRLIPSAANSITVSFNSGSTIVSSQTVPRPTSGNVSTVTFSGIPAGSYTMKAQAFPTTTGTGTAQASASKVVAITAGNTTATSISMASTINSLALTPTTPTTNVGSTVTLVATPLDATGTVVLIGGTLSWSSSSTAVATVAPSGVVTGVAAGTATITATESESGKTASLTVTVNATTGGAVVTVS